MKKALALLMALTLLLCLSAPLYALADGSIALLDNEAPVVNAEPQEAVEPEPAAPEPAEPDPGGNYINLSDIIQAAFAVLFALFMRYVAPWIKARTNQWQRDMLVQITGTLVEAAEQKLGSGAGKEKMNYVISGLHERGYTIDEDLIEAIVRGLPENIRPK